MTAISPPSRKRRLQAPQAPTSGQVRRRAMDALRAASNQKLITDEERKAAMKYIRADASEPNKYFRETIMCSNGNEENENDRALLGRDIAENCPASATPKNRDS
jgi:hypothetical protein